MGAPKMNIENNSFYHIQDIIDNKIVNHQFSPQEEEQILSLINLQEIFRFEFSEFCCEISSKT